MATEITLPELGDGIESGDILEVFISVGDTVSEGDDIVEVETDKASVPVPATVSGTVVSVDVEPGQTVNIGAILITVEGGDVPAIETPVAEPCLLYTSPSPRD